MSYSTLVDTPTRSTINGGLVSPDNDVVREYLGDPGRNARIKTQSVGPFRVTGHAVALLSLKHIFDRVKMAKPDLYDIIGNEGMFNNRTVRNADTVSNHAWGIAIDIKIDGVLPDFNAPQVPQGFIDLYPFFHEAKWFWGAGYRRRTDPMHFEASKQLLESWSRLGLI